MTNVVQIKPRAIKITEVLHERIKAQAKAKFPGPGAVAAGSQLAHMAGTYEALLETLISVSPEVEEFIVNTYRIEV